MDNIMLVWVLIGAGAISLVVGLRILPSFTQGIKEIKKQRSSVSSNVRPSPVSVGEAMDVEDEYRFNFRRARWGMNGEQVKHSEDSTAAITEGAETISYKSRLGHMDCQITYNLGGADQLVGGRYDFLSRYEDGTRYLSDFDTLLSLYKDRFGEPAALETTWLNSTFERKKELHGIAFMEGHFSRYAYWQTLRTSVALFLGYDDDGNVLFFIEYNALRDETGQEAQTAGSLPEDEPQNIKPHNAEPHNAEPHETSEAE